MRDLRKVLRQYIDLRRALGYKLRKHEPRLTEFIGFLKTQGTDRITTKLAVAWATESSKTINTAAVKGCGSFGRSQDI